MVSLDDCMFSIYKLVKSFTTKYNSICAHLCCDSVNDLDAYAIGLSSCKSTAPSPDFEASTEILHGLDAS